MSRAFKGVIPALAVPFRDDYKIDEDGLARFSRWLAGGRGVTALMTNGHTGEVGSLLPEDASAHSSLLSVREDSPLEAVLSNHALRNLGALAAVDADGRLRGVLTADAVGRALRQPAAGAQL